MRVFLKSLLIILTIAGFTLVTFVVKRVSPERGKWWLAQRCFRCLLAIVGVRCTVRGKLAEGRPLLLVTNHSSYLDVIMLGAMGPVRFTPKAEVRTWPAIGGICKLLDCIFIDRRANQAQQNMGLLREALAEGSVVCLFPEGTTNDGKRVLPFRSSYFGLAEESFGGRPLAVQPAAITYTRICNIPIDSSQRPHIAWYGDMELVPHLGSLLKLGPIQAELLFLEPVDLAAFPSRKALATYCREVIAQQVQQPVIAG